MKSDDTRAARLDGVDHDRSLLASFHEDLRGVVSSMFVPHSRPRDFLAQFSELHFIHIPKTAGKFLTKGAARGKVPHLHNPSLVNHAHCMASSVSRTPTFSIVRNPYDWLVSMFEHSTDRDVGWGNSARDWDEPANWKASSSCSGRRVEFEQYVERLMLGQLPADLHHRTDVRLFSQSPFFFILNAEHELQVDFFIKYENLIPSMALVLDVDENTLASRGVINASKKRDRKPYQEYYSLELIDRVKEHYSTTFALFDYGFDTLSEQKATIYVDPSNVDGTLRCPGDSKEKT